MFTHPDSYPDDYGDAVEEFFSLQDEDKSTVDGRFELEDVKEDLSKYYKAMARVSESVIFLDRCIAIEEKYSLNGLSPEMVTGCLSEMIKELDKGESDEENQKE